MKKIRNEKGFTIIEVVLVLAIAGLIFLMVFIALPALQASQRDSARKKDVTSVAAAVTQFTSNNKGAFPSSAKINEYTNNSVSDNTQTVVVNNTTGAGNVGVSDGVITITQGTTCSDTGKDSQTLKKGAVRQFTVVTRLEAGGGTSFCLDS